MKNVNSNIENSKNPTGLQAQATGQSHKAQAQQATGNKWHRHRATSFKPNKNIENRVIPHSSLWGEGLNPHAHRELWGEYSTKTSPNRLKHPLKLKFKPLQ